MSRAVVRSLFSPLQSWGYALAWSLGMGVLGWLEQLKLQATSFWETSEHAMVWLLGLAVIAGVRRQAVRQTREREALQAQVDVGEQRWRAVLAATGDGLWDWDGEKNTCFYSARWKAMIGFGEAEFPDTYEAWVDRIHPADRPRVLASVEANLAGQLSHHEVEYRMQCRDGSFRWMLGRGRVIARAADGRALRAVGTQTDITERREAQEQSRLEAERHRFFLEHAVDPMVAYHFGDDGLPTSFVEVNAAACRLCGYTRERMLRLSPRTLEYRPDPAVSAARLATLGRERRLRVEIEISVADGSVVPVEFEGELREFAGRSIVLATVRDLRARREILARQQREAEQAQLLAELYRRAATLSDEETCEHVLGVAVAVTQSEGGVLRWFGPAGRDEGRTDWPRGRAVVAAREAQWQRCLERGQTLLENSGDGERRVGVPLPGVEGDLVIGVWGKAGEYAAEDVARLQAIGEELKKVRLQLAAERALEFERRRFRALFAHAPLGILEEDFSRVQTRINALRQAGVRDFQAHFAAHPEVVEVMAGEIEVLIANQRSAELFGVERPEDLLGAIGPHLAPEAWPVVAAELVALASGETRFASEIPAVSRRGERLVLELSLAVVPGHEARLDRVVVSFADMTARRAVEAALSESERRYRRLVEFMPEAILIVAHGRVVFANPAAATLVGAGSPAEVIGTDPLTFVHADSLSLARDRIRRLDSAERNPFVEQKWVRRDGAVIPVGVGASQFEFNGEPAHLLLVHDLSALRQAEANARKLAQAVEQSPVTVVITDVDGVIEYANPQFSRATGYSLAEALGQNPRILNSGAMPAEFFAEMWATLTSGREWRGEICNRRKDGTLYWEEACISPLVDGAGKTTGYLAVKEDVTAQRATLAALRASERRFRSLAEGLPNIAVQGCDRERRVVFWNAASTALYGYTREEALGRRREELIVPEAQRPALIAAVERWVTHGEPLPAGETVLRRKDGRLVTVFSSHVLLQQSSGELELHSIDIDLTASKAAEAQIREQAGLINATRDAFIVVELDGRIRFWNRGAERLYGWAAEEVVGRPLSDLPLSADAMAPDQARQAIRAHGQWSGELTQRSRAGTALTVRAQGQLLRDPAGEPSAILLTASDVTEAKQLEVRFLRAQRLESVGALASGVAHDLNNVLSPIMMSVELLRPLAVTEPDREVLRLMSDSARRGADVVRQLLLFGRGVDAPSETMDLAKVHKEILRMLRETFPRNLEISGQCPRDLWTVRGHATEIYQVLLNLCVNARDAMPLGGRLRVDAVNLHVDEGTARQNPGARAGRHVVLKVADTGTGIAPEHIDRIFDPFFTTKEQGKGTGLGLSTVLGIAKSHGGFVTVASKVGSGTEFRFHLPATETGAPDTAPVDDTMSWHGRGEQILVVDDEPAIRQVLGRALAENGYRVLTAVNGAEAVTLCARHQATLAAVVLDMMMPGLDGPQVLKLLREQVPGLPVIACSGLHGYASTVEKLGLAQVIFVPKPVEIPRLMEKVRLLLDAEADNRPVAAAGPIS